MQKCLFMVLFFLAALGATMAMAQETHLSGLPGEAFSLLAQSQTEGCVSCAKKLKNKAFSLLDKALGPGDMITPLAGCLFKKPDTEGNNFLTLSCYPGCLVKEGEPTSDYPALLFRFHTRRKHMAGVREKDHTKKKPAEMAGYAISGETFSGKLEIIRYPYGDGKFFNHNANFNRLEVHVKILELQPARAK